MASRSRGEEGALGFRDGSWACSSSTILEWGDNEGALTLVECWRRRNSEARSEATC